MQGEFGLTELSLQTVGKELHLRLLEWLLGSLLLAPLFAALTGTIVFLLSRAISRKLYLND